MLKSVPKYLLTKLFGNLTRRIISKHNVKVVAIAGSVGKTSTKSAIAQILQEKYNLHFQAGNYNTSLSVPFIFLNTAQPSPYAVHKWFAAYLRGMNILRKKKYYEVVVVELGADRPGDIIDFKDFLTPDLSVVTAVSPEHMAQFRTMEAVAKEELSLSKFSKKILLNIDDIGQVYLEKYLSNFDYHTYGVSKKADVVFGVNQKNQKTEIKIKFLKSEITINTSLVGLPAAKSIVAAVYVGIEFGLSEAEIKNAAEKITAMPGRMNVLPGINKTTIIDDTYNSSPLAVRAALEVLGGWPAPQKIAVLGMMNELGSSSKKEHEEMGSLCSPSSISLLVTLGRDSNSYTAPAADANGCRVIEATSPAQAAKAVIDNIKEGAVILIKGSQNGVYAEEIVKKLLKDATDENNLVRQSKYWMNIKKKQFGDQL
jgi:UDP-N-acetylmuramoyl-tripeptide--D-alanyl-D-alanine ligase